METKSIASLTSAIRLTICEFCGSTKDSINVNEICASGHAERSEVTTPKRKVDSAVLMSGRVSKSKSMPAKPLPLAKDTSWSANAEGSDRQWSQHETGPVASGGGMHVVLVSNVNGEQCPIAQPPTESNTRRFATAPPADAVRR